MVTFFPGGMAAISGARVTTAPFRYVSLLLGAVSLLTLISTLLLGDNSPLTALGIGGIWIVYPVILLSSPSAVTCPVGLTGIERPARGETRGV